MPDIRATAQEAPSLLVNTAGKAAQAGRPEQRARQAMVFFKLNM